MNDIALSIAAVAALVAVFGGLTAAYCFGYSSGLEYGRKKISELETYQNEQFRKLRQSIRASGIPISEDFNAPKQ